MLTLRGKFTNGEIQLLDPAPGSEECFVLITFVDEQSTELRSVNAQLTPMNRPGPGPSARPTHDMEPLTRREHEVLRLMPTGKNNREMAQKLGISEGTTRNYVSRIYRKLDAGNRAEAVAKAVRWALIPLD
jgi:DNA-binding NarL/FixJ family response regulator